MPTTRARRAATVLMSLFVALGLLVVLDADPSSGDPGDPLEAPYVDNQTHALEGDAEAWFKFDYGADDTLRTMVLATLVDGAGSDLSLEIWAPELVHRWRDIEPANLGIVAELDCQTGKVMIGGACRSRDVTWTGAFESPGTYYVRVINRVPSPRDFRLMVLGPGVSLGPPSATGADSTAAQTPTPLFVDDPNQGVDIDGQPHLIPAMSARWYKFNYGAPGSSARPVVHLRLVNGVVTGLRFEVWAPDNINNWWEKKPVGRGTQEVTIICACPLPTATLVPSPTGQPTATATPTSTPEPTETPEPEVTATVRRECTHTPANDLTWSGAFGGPGTFYVRVVNENRFPVEYVLLLK